MNVLFARNLRALVLVLTPLFLRSAAVASELIVPAGCDAPPHSSGGKTFYIDPIHGSMHNDGSAERPWRTFAEVASQSSHLISNHAHSTDPKSLQALSPINPDGPIKPGDTWVLMSGDHGAVDLRLYDNKDFIQVVAGKNETPVIPSMRIVSSSHWLFRGLKFRGVRPEKNLYGGMVEVLDTRYGPADNIVFVSNSFTTQDDVADWKDADWVRLPYQYAFKTFSRCTTLFDNHFYNIRNAASIAGPDNLVMNNLIEAAGNDGFDIMASNLTVRRNVIRAGHHTAAEPMHADGIQGWSLRNTTNSNVVVEGNTVIDINQSDDNYMQGISIFDGVWDGLIVSNNLVFTNHWHGIALYGVDHAVVVNNTVLPSKPNKYLTWIAIQASKTRRQSSHVVVRNNIAGQILAGGFDVQVDHNIALGPISSRQFRADPDLLSDADFAFNEQNVPEDTLFRNLDRASGSHDFHLAPKSPAVESGASDLAPAVDIEGRSRKSPIDVGAYAR